MCDLKSMAEDRNFRNLLLVVTKCFGRFRSLFLVTLFAAFAYNFYHEVNYYVESVSFNTNNVNNKQLSHQVRTIRYVSLISPDSRIDYSSSLTEKDVYPGSFHTYHSSHGNTDEAILSLLTKARALKLVIKPPNEEITSMRYTDIGRYLDHLTLFEQLTAESFNGTDCLVIYPNQVLRKTELNQINIECDHLLRIKGNKTALKEVRLENGIVTIFNSRMLVLYMNIRSGDSNVLEPWFKKLQASIDLSAPLRNVDPVDNLNNPPAVSFESWNDCISSTNLPCVLEVLHSNNNRQFNVSSDVWYATIQLPLKYSHPRRIENVKVMKKVVPHMHVYNGFHGNDLASITRLVKECSKFNLTVSKQYDRGHWEHIHIGKMGHWVSFLNVFKDVLSQPEGEVPKCILLVEDDFWFRLVDHRNIQWSCEQLVNKPHDHTVFMRLSKYDAANLFNVSLLKKIFDAIANGGISDPFDNFTYRLHMFEKGRARLKSTKIKLHSTLWSQPRFKSATWNKCMKALPCSLTLYQGRRRYEVKIKA